MMLAIVGSRTLDGNANARIAIASVIEQYRPSVVVSGGAVGIDTMAEKMARALGVDTLIMLPTVQKWDGLGGYKERNARIVESCDRLVCIFDPDSETRGSGWTPDLAE